MIELEINDSETGEYICTLRSDDNGIAIYHRDTKTPICQMNWKLLTLTLLYMGEPHVSWTRWAMDTA